MTRWLHALILAVGLAIPQAAPAVVILDSVWREEGGGRGHETAGFGAHIHLAQEPQFRAVLSLSLDGGTSWGDGSGTWIGNDASHAYILTSAHNFDDSELSEARFRTDDGTILRGERLWIHPDYDAGDDWSGRDAAIVRLSRPITNLGPPPVLYSGNAEQGRVITFVGYGTRGIASVGEDESYNVGLDKAAAQGRVDEVEPLRRPTDDQDAGNSLAVFLPREDGRIDNPLGGPRRPVSRLAGLLGGGDSGGSAWMQDGDGWVIVGINTAGDGKAGYGDFSWFVRTTGIRPWIQSVFPSVAFASGGTRPITVPAKFEPAPLAAAVSLCAPRARVFALSDDAWYPARARNPGKGGTCSVHFEDFDDEEDAFVEPDDLLAWSADGPGRAVASCDVGLAVVAEDNGVWYPATIKRSKGDSCVVEYDDDSFKDEILPLEQIRRLR
jgi:hypothetical protein